MRPAINPLWPVRHLQDVNELLGIAVAMEAEAAARYDDLEAEMNRQGDRPMADLFGRLARLEREHAEGVARWAERTGAGRPVPVEVGWEMPESFSTATDLSRLTPYEALAAAVRNEERAFSFYTYLAAIADAAAVRERAEALAREELEHVALLRGMRRKAFHAARPKPRRLPRDLGALRAMARVLDAGAAVPGDEDALRQAIRATEDAVDDLLEVAEAATDQAVMAEAQALAGTAVSRLTLLRSRLRQAD